MASHGGFCDTTAFLILNGEYHSLACVPVHVSVNTYIREYAGLKGTKFMCQEGGCGACVVSLEFTHPVTGEQKTVSVNSCMFPVYSCHGLSVTTVEGVGNKQKGYDKIQTRLAQFYGSQCGYCTPGWVMSMYSLIQTNPKATMEEIENSFSGNLCRCTGYRPILDAFKSFASDRSQDLEQQVLDIEDLSICIPKKKVYCNKLEEGKTKKNVNSEKEEKEKDKSPSPPCSDIKSYIKLNTPLSEKEQQWFKVTNMDEVFEILQMIKSPCIIYKLVAGNTALGIIKNQPPTDVFIDISMVPILKDQYFHSGSWYVGANITLADIIVLCKAVADENPKYFSYLRQFAHHVENVANTPVRNVGTLAGNLSIKHQLRSFQSDIYLLLDAVGAFLCIQAEREAISVISLAAYLETNMYKKVILQIIFPPLDNCLYVFKSYKVAPRAQNALALVNAAFLCRVDQSHKYLVLEKPRIVFGNISPDFSHASQTEEYLTGKSLLEAATLRKALDLLGREVRPDQRPTEPSPEYRTHTAQALFYKFVLSLCPEAVTPCRRSGGQVLPRPLSSGRQEFDTDSSRPPLYQPNPKLDALLQCSGEAEFVNDIHPISGEVFCALVISKMGPADLVGLDPREALKEKGALAFYSAKDIPGENTFTPKERFVPEKEELFASKKICYAGQPVGVMVAETQKCADLAAEKVCILYGEKKKPIIDVREVIKIGDTSRITPTFEKKATKTKDDVKKVVEGSFYMGTQYHFTMETMACVVVPVDGELDVYCTSQWLTQAQETVALVLGIPENKINVRVRRVGGGYGQKITRSNLVAGACALAAHKLHRPARMVTKLETVLEAIGKRWPCFFNYKVGVNGEGEIQYVTTNMYNDAGSAGNDDVSTFAFEAFTNVYDPSTWSAKLFRVKTDKACTTWMRAPGTLEAITMAETIMEHIAHDLCRDSLDIRMINMDKSYPIFNMISQLKDKSDYESRRAAVQDYNKRNLFKKKGISLVPMRFPMATLSSYHAIVCVYRNDGTVVVCHGGVEIGQGINTKAAQVCASALNIPLSFVVVKPTNNLTCPNDQVTGGSFTSESVCYAVEQCCLELNRRLQPIREKLINPTWQEIVQAAYEAAISLKACKMFSSVSDFKSYQIYGACVTEVEVDLLTGELRCVRADILEDLGKSMNPRIDIGQVEGAFIMGLGYFTSEKVKYDCDTGRVLTNTTLTYKIPGPKDIPMDLRVNLLKNADNPLGILGSKAVGEPPICLAISILFAIRAAMRSARCDLGLPDIWLPMDAPFTAENIKESCGINASYYCL